MNRKKLIGIIALVVLLLVGGFFWFVWGERFNEVNEEIKCVPASCCHSTSCVLESEAPDCNGRFCTLSCEPGTLDCGQGNCEYINEECEVVWNE